MKNTILEKSLTVANFQPTSPKAFRITALSYKTLNSVPYSYIYNKNIQSTIINHLS